MTTPNLPPSTIDPNQQQSTAPLEETCTVNAQPHDAKSTVAEQSNPFHSPTTSTFPKIPGFEIDAELGRGGMGVVYKARQTGLDRVVALKMILKADFATPEQKLRFQIEAENAARVQHPSIVQVYEIGEYQGQPFFAQEFVAGGSLADGLKSHRMSPGAAAAFVETLARAVHAAHVQGIIHRDLKPANILLDGYSQPKITDFGLAKRLDASNNLTDSGTVMGTPSYMAPEQARGETRHVGPAADQYALGVILYQLLTGRLPFEAPSVPEILKNIIEEEPVAPAVRSAAVPLDLSIICLKCLEKDPERRYATAEALAEDLKNWREHRPIVARPATRTERVVKWCRRYPAVAGLIAVSLLAAMVSSGLAWWAVRAEAAAVAERDAKDDALRKEQVTRLEAETNLSYARTANEILASVFTGLDPKAAYETVAELRSALKNNLTKAIAELDGSAIGDPLEVAKMQNTLGHSLMGLGEPMLAIAMFEKSRATRSALLGPDHPDTLLSMNNLAACYYTAGKYDQALPLHEETLRLRKEKLGPDHPDTLTSLNNLALGYHATGKLELALPLYEETLRLRQAKLGPDHPDTLTSLNNLAAGYLAAGKLEDALPLFKESLQLHQAQFGPDHPDTLGMMDSLAAGYQAAGKFELALPLYEETLKRRKAKLGPDHINTLGSMHNLARGYYAVGKIDLALPLYRETLRLASEKLGADHPNTLTCMNNYAQALQDAGQLEQALLLFAEVLKLTEAKLGPDHPDTLTCIGNLAEGYQAAGKLDLALPLLEKTLQLKKEKLGPDHPDTLNGMNNLAVGYQAAGKLDLALPLYEETLRLKKAKLGPDHPDTLACMGNLAEGYRVAGMLDQALPLMEETLQRRRAKLGPNHPHTLINMSNLATGYRAAGKLDLAIPLQVETLQLMKAHLGPEHPNTVICMAGLAESYRANGDFDQALPLLEESLPLMKEKLGPNHPHTLTTMNNLAAGYRSAGKLEMAVTLLQEVLQQMQASLGEDHPHTIHVMGNLGAAFSAAGQGEKAAHVLKEFVSARRKDSARDDPDFSALLAQVSLDLLQCKQFTAAEEMLREALAIREKTQADAWTTFNTQSVLGEALLGQQKHAEAEPLLLSGYEGIKERLASPGSDPELIAAQQQRLAEACDRLIQLYSALDKPDEVQKWQAERAKYPPPAGK